jgi:hypothetical protein
MTSRSVQDQVERIIDEGEGPTRSVIVQVRSPAAGAAPLAAAAGAVRARALAQTARDCLPPARSLGAEQASPVAADGLRRDPAGLPGSLSAAGSGTGAAAVGRSARASTLAALDRLASHHAVRRFMAETGAPSHALWAAGAMALELGVDDLARLVGDGDGVAAVHPNRRLPLPPIVEATNLPAAVTEAKAGSWGVERTGALAAWGAYGARGAGSKVGVVDTGVDAAHPELAGKVAGWAEFDGNGRPVPGSVPHDDRGHGTHVCGTIAGGNAGGQWIGVAPECQLFVAQVLGPEGGTDAQVLAGIGWAIDQGVDVVSMSLGGLTLGPETPSTYTNALVTALGHGIPVVVAIGNDGSETSGAPGNDLFALGVGATDHLDRPAGFSGGRTQILTQSDFVDPRQLPLPYSKPELSAPGVAVVSAWPGGQYKALDGTSMATPHVSGAVAVLLSATRVRDVVAEAERAFVVSDLLIGSVAELGEAGQDHRYGFGRLNVLDAIGFARDRGY